ncbi:MAG: hypothetical protein PUI05_07165 [Peptoniphilaceae bacterium]|nr:hypothetical protein [Peptoniphilaceae bacterium]
MTDTNKYKVKILDIIDEIPNVKTFKLEKPDGVDFREGASFRLEIPREGKSLTHDFSINSLPSDDYISFTTKFSVRKSEFKKELLSKTIGDELLVSNIESHMGLRYEDRPIVLISMGVGVTTMLPLIRTYLNDKGNIPQVKSYTIALEGKRVFEDKLASIEDKEFSQAWLSGRKEFFDSLNEIILPNCIVYLVGSNEFLLDTIVKLRELGLSDDDIMIDMADKKKKVMFIAAKNHQVL